MGSHGPGGEREREWPQLRKPPEGALTKATYRSPPLCGCSRAWVSSAAGGLSRKVLKEEVRRPLRVQPALPRFRG